MKRRITPFIALIPTLIFSSCSANISISTKQAVQILDMIIYEQSVENFSHFSSKTEDGTKEFSYRYSTSKDGVETIQCLYEISEKNKILHFYNPASSEFETWYYIESGILYRSYKNQDGELITSIIEGDKEQAESRFNIEYYGVIFDEARKKIIEIDKPAKIKEQVEGIQDIDKRFLSSKFVTKRNYQVTGKVKVFDDWKHKNLLRFFEFEYADKILHSYSYQNEDDEYTSSYRINYDLTLTLDSIK